MPGTPEEVERDARQDERPNSSFSPQLLAWLIRIAAVIYVAGLVYELSSDDAIRLHVLHATTRILQSAARILGRWALLTEASYNEYVSNLH